MEKYFNESESPLVAKRVNQWISEASAQPRPEKLWMSLWYRNELACLFADTNMGKSIYAVQIADSISRNEPVIYLDFEMSAKQFQLRYTDETSGAIYPFHDNFVRIEMQMDDGDITLPDLIDCIEHELERWQSRVLIIDNITWLSNATECGEEAGQLMQMLIALKRKCDLSILVLAHTPKRPLSMPLTQNSLAGSKRLANFMDSIFAIGADPGNTPAGRYVKQIKVRSSEMEFGADSVIRTSLVKEGCNLRFRDSGTAPENKILESSRSSADKSQLILDLKAQGMSHRQICAHARVSASTVQEVLHKANA